MAEQEENKPSNKQRNILMIGGFAVAIVICIVCNFLGIGKGNTDGKDTIAQTDFNSTLPNAQVEEMTDDKLEAMKREQARQSMEDDGEGSNSFGLLDGSVDQSQRMRVNAQEEDLSEEINQQQEEAQRKLQEQRDALDAQRKKLASAKSTVAGPSSSNKKEQRRFDVGSIRQQNQDLAYKQLQAKYGKGMYPDKKTEPAKKVESTPAPAATATATPTTTTATTKKKGFNTLGASKGASGHDIRAVVHGTHKNLTTNSIVKLRLLDPMTINGTTIPKNSFVYGKVSFGSGRVQISIDNVNYQDNVLPFKGAIYDQDGSQGIYVPDNAISDASKDAGSSSVNGTSTNASTRSSNIIRQNGVSVVNNAVSAVKNGISKKVSENKVSISANYRVTIREKK